MRTILMAAAVVLALSACNRHRPSDRLDDNQVATKPSLRSARITPATRCASSRTYDLIKHELFRQAAQLRGKDDTIFDRLAGGAALRVERPVVDREDEGLGSIACSAAVALDLPPGLSVAGGRASLSADLDYTLRPAADASGDVVTLTNADAITVPLATIGRSGDSSTAITIPRGSTVASQPSPIRPVDRPAPPPAMVLPGMRSPIARPSAPPPPRVASATQGAIAAPHASPSFPCRRARTSGEMMICRDEGLAQIDRRMSAQYRDAYASASSGQRSALLATAHRFYGYRDNCPDARCISNGYRDRMREIDDIMRNGGPDD